MRAATVPLADDSDSPLGAALAELSAAILDYDPERARTAAQAVVDAGADPMQVIEGDLKEAAAEVGRKFESNEFFIPQLVLAGEALTAAMEVFQAAMPEHMLEDKKVAVIGTVEGDIHTIGKNAVATMLRWAGFTVNDLGVGVSVDDFIARALDLEADLIAASALLTTTMPHMEELIVALVDRGLRERFKVIVGGGPVTQGYADRIGADGFGVDAIAGARIAASLAGLEQV